MQTTPKNMRYIIKEEIECELDPYRALFHFLSFEKEKFFSKKKGKAEKYH